jgi:hypothetical protein
LRAENLETAVCVTGLPAHARRERRRLPYCAASRIEAWIGSSR